jgi:putative oxidoreductase
MSRLMLLASIPMAAVLLVAMFTVHLPYGFSSIKLQAVTAAGAQFGPSGFETDLLYLACLAALAWGLRTICDRRSFGTAQKSHLPRCKTGGA